MMRGDSIFEDNGWNCHELKLGQGLKSVIRGGSVSNLGGGNSFEVALEMRFNQNPAGESSLSLSDSFKRLYKSKMAAKSKRRRDNMSMKFPV